MIPHSANFPGDTTGHFFVVEKPGLDVPIWVGTLRRLQRSRFPFLYLLLHTISFLRTHSTSGNQGGPGMAGQSL